MAVMAEPMASQARWQRWFNYSDFQKGGDELGTTGIVEYSCSLLCLIYINTIYAPEVNIIFLNPFFFFSGGLGQAHHSAHFQRGESTELSSKCSSDHVASYLLQSQMF